MKKRISLSLRDGLISEIDRSIGIIDSTRSGVIENILDKFIEENKTCVILAGGPPQNLWDEKNQIYRPFVKINGSGNKYVF